MAPVPVFRFGDFELDTPRRRLTRGGAPVRLRAQEFNLLCALVRRMGAPVPRAELMAEVWQGQLRTDGVLPTLVWSLRRALGDEAGTLVVSVSGIGYQLAAAVEHSSGLGPDRAAARLPHNLPAETSSFIGRTAELAAIIKRLGSRRLVTLVGDGGVGKTRIAVRAAAEMLPHFPDGAWFVDLAPIADPDMVPEAVSRVMGFPPEAGAAGIGALAHLLEQRKLLLILDNCEHVRAGAGALAAAIGRACGGVHILATSRELLRVTGEVVFPLPTLAVPPASPVLTAAQALAADAVQLFVDRAADAIGEFTLTDADAPAVTAICRRLDGMPLATELVAAGLRVLRPAEIAARLETIFALLGPSARAGAPDHQRTLQATIDWSFSMLDAAEQTLLQRLAVFVGGCTLEAAEEVVAGDGVRDGQLLPQLTALIDKSLIRAEPSGDGTRYRMLETTRQYAVAQLAAAGGAVACLRRRAVCMVRLYEEAERTWPTMGTEAWLGRYAGDTENLRAAIDWAFSQSEIALGLALVASSGAIVAENSLQPDLQRWTALAVPHLPQAPRHTAARIAYLHAMRLKHLGAPGMLPEWRRVIGLFREAGDELGLSRALRQAAIGQAAPSADPAEPLAMLEEAVRLIAPRGPTKDLATAYAHMGSVYFLAGRHTEARRHNDLALEMRRHLRDSSGVLASHLNLAELCFMDGDVAGALDFAVRAEAEAAEHRALATRAHILGNIAGYRLAQGEIAAALEAAREALRLNRALRQDNFAVICLEHLALAALLQGDLPRAARLVGHTEAQYRAGDQIRDRLEQAGHARLVAGLAARLGPAELQSYRAEGAAMSAEEADALAG